MRLLLKSKHQRLILQCYPPGKSVDKKPNPSELSYLLYYATTRRTKLLKVGVFLQKKVISDYNHNRTGNLSVSLDIILGLIDKCSDNLDAFAINLLVIFKHILMTKDLALCQYLLPIFSNFCKTIKSDIFNGDLEFINKFEDVCKNLVQFGYNPIAPNQNDWTVLSLQSIQGFSPTLAYNNGLTEALVKHSMALILSNIYEIDKLGMDSHLNPDGTNELRKLSTIKHVTTLMSNPQDVIELEGGTVELEAYRSLNKLFDTTSNSTGNQLQNSSTALIDYMIAHKASSSWANRIIQLSVNWIPVSSRFRFLDSLFQRLISTKDHNKKLVLAGQVSGLLSSPVTLISLDVPGTLKILCREQLALVTDDINSCNDELVLSFNNCIRSLTSHLYYRNQISDMISVLLKECTDYMEGHNLEGRYRNLILVLFNDVDTLLKKLSRDTNESVSLDIWEDTFPFLYLQDATLVRFYCRLIISYLDIEVKNSELSQKPNFNKYITNQFSPLSQFFQYADNHFQSSSIIFIDLFYPVLLKLIEKFGLNTIANGLPFFFSWQLNNFTLANDIDKLKDTVLFIFIYESSKFLHNSELQNAVLNKVKYREIHHLIHKTNYQFPTGSTEDSDPVLTKNTLKQLINDDSVSSWLDLDSKSRLKEDYNSSFMSNTNSFTKQSSLPITNGNTLAINNNNNPFGGTVRSNGDAPLMNRDTTINSTTSSPSFTTPITTIDQVNDTLHSSFHTRSFTPVSSFQSKHIPRVSELKNFISSSNLRPSNFSNVSVRDGFGSSVVSSRIVDDVGSLLAELDVDGELSSDDEESSFNKGRLIR